MEFQWDAQSIHDRFVVEGSCQETSTIIPMMAANDVVILQSPVDIDNKSHVISLTPSQIIVEGCWRAAGDDSATPEPVFRKYATLTFDFPFVNKQLTTDKCELITRAILLQTSRHLESTLKTNS